MLGIKQNVLFFFIIAQFNMPNAFANSISDVDRCVFKLHGELKGKKTISINKVVRNYESLQECKTIALQWLGKHHDFGTIREKYHGQWVTYRISTQVNAIDIRFYEAGCQEADHDKIVLKEETSYLKKLFDF